MRIAVVVGTRPEVIKLAPVVTLLGREALVVHTGQHHSTGMSGHLTPDVRLDTPEDRNSTRGRQLGHLVTALDDTFVQHQPDAVLVQGDTTSALAGALAANTGAPDPRGPPQQRTTRSRTHLRPQNTPQRRRPQQDCDDLAT